MQVVILLDDDAKADGLTKDEIRIDVERTLRLNGIKVDSKATPNLLVQIVKLNIGSRGDSVPYRVFISFSPVAIMGGRIEALTESWHESSTLFSNGEIANNIRERIQHLMKMFISDYLFV